jgi:ADP-heptose:LPS heptosyltransferase
MSCCCRAGSDAESNRRWPEEKYVELAKRIADNGVTPVVLGGTEERPIGAAIAKAEPRAKNLVTRPDLFQCIALSERAAFAVGDDVELMHVAAAAGAPCLVFQSSTAKGAPAARRVAALGLWNSPLR